MLERFLGGIKAKKRKIKEVEEVERKYQERDREGKQQGRLPEQRKSRLGATERENQIKNEVLTPQIVSWGGGGFIDSTPPPQYLIC